MKKILLLLLVGIVLLGSLTFISAVNQVSYGRTVMTLDAPRTAPTGTIINFTSAQNITAIKKTASSTATQCYIRTEYNGANLTTASFVGDWCNFSTPFAVNSSWKNYTLLLDANGSNYNRYYNNTGPPAMPILNNTVFWHGGFSHQGEYTTTSHEGFVEVAFNNATAGNFNNVSVTLISPANNSQSTNTPQTFTATLTNDTYPLVNATLYIWFSNGTIYNVTTNASLVSTSTHNVTFNVTMNGVDNYVWNVRGVQGNGVPLENSSFATANNTVLWGIANTGEEYNTPVLEQSTQTFKVNITLSGFSISTAILVYNGTNYTASFASVNSTTTQITRTIIVPSVAADINLSFYWNVNFTTSAALVSTTAHNQTVLNFAVDNCASGTVMIFNFTLVDEQSQIKFVNATNTSIKVDLDFYSNSTSITPAFEYSHNYNMTNPARVCLSSALANASYYVDAQIEYAATNYANEFYNIQKYSLNASNNPSQNITLYDLISTSNQVFKITYRDSSYLPVSNALIQIGRLYVDEGTTKTVEIPKTDSYGTTLGNLELNNGVYTFTVTKNGVVLDVFPNSVAICQNPTITPCEINLNGLASNLPLINFTTLTDFLYTLTYNNATRTISTTFTIPSGAAATVLLNVSTTTAIKTSVCSTSIVTSSGTLTCVVPASFGNTTVRAELYKSGVLVAWGNIDLAQTPKQLYGTNIVFISIFIFLTILGAGISDNPIVMVISFMIGVFLLIMLNLVDNTGFIGGGATVLYLVIAIVIILIKGVNRN